MRGLPVRRLASTALCAALLAGVTGPAAVAADDSARQRVPAASAPVPGSDALLTQVKGLGDLGTVLAPLTELLNAVLKADNGQLSPNEAAKLVQAAKDAIARVNAAEPPTSSPSTLPAPYRTGSDALTKALDTLEKAATSGDVGQVAPAVSEVLTGLVTYLTGLLLDSGLPAPAEAAPARSA